MGAMMIGERLSVRFPVKASGLGHATSPSSQASSRGAVPHDAAR
jgi:hypothetical protein